MREGRVRAALGEAYSGLDIPGIIDGSVPGEETDAAVDQLRRALDQADLSVTEKAEGRFEIDEFCGTSVGGINRTGLFSMQKMYKDIHQKLSAKLKELGREVEGRPIQFRDLPFKLKVCGKVLNTDLPPDDPLRRKIDGDTRLVMSSETTPNLDVVAAIISSAAVPGFFQSPIMEIPSSVETSPGVKETRIFQMQLCDGGVLDNLPISTANPEEGADRSLVLLPARSATIDPETGEKTELGVLNFDDSNLPLIDAHNREFYQSFASQVAEMLRRSEDAGAKRAVLAFGLFSEGELAAPAVQGTTPEFTRRLHGLAGEIGLNSLNEAASREFLRGLFPPPGGGGKFAAWAYDNYVDWVGDSEDNEFHRDRDGAHARVGVTEEENALDVLRSAASGALANSRSEFASRVFERPA